MCYLDLLSRLVISVTFPVLSTTVIDALLNLTRTVQYRGNRFKAILLVNWQSYQLKVYLLQHETYTKMVSLAKLIIIISFDSCDNY